MNVTFTWNLVADGQQMLQFPFMVRAFQAGTLVALVGGVLGWVMVLRRQTFAGHTLSVAAFPGAAAATLAGVGVVTGYYVGCLVAAALVIAFGSSRRGFSGEGAVIGTVQALALGSGFLFASLSGNFTESVQSELFGSFFGITAAQVRTLVIAVVVVLAVLVAMWRPLLFASVDATVAAANRVPVRLLEAGFVVLLGLAAAGISQITGALLVFALLVMPAAVARRLTVRPWTAVLWSVVLAVLCCWIGLTWAFFSDRPVGFTITTLAFVLYVAVGLASTLRTRLGGRSADRRALTAPAPEPVR